MTGSYVMLDKFVPALEECAKMGIGYREGKYKRQNSDETDETEKMNEDGEPTDD